MTRLWYLVAKEGTVVALSNQSAFVVVHVDQHQIVISTITASAAMSSSLADAGILEGKN